MIMMFRTYPFLFLLTREGVLLLSATESCVGISSPAFFSTGLRTMAMVAFWGAEIECTHMCKTIH